MIKKIKEFFKKISPILKKVFKILVIVLISWLSFGYLSNCSDNKLFVYAQSENPSSYYIYEYNPNITLIRQGYYQGYIFNDEIIINNIYLEIELDEENDYAINRMTISNKHNITYYNSSSSYNLTTNSFVNLSYDFLSNNNSLGINKNNIHKILLYYDLSAHSVDFEFSRLYRNGDTTNYIDLSLDNSITFSGPSINWYKGNYISSININCNEILNYINTEYNDLYNNGYRDGLDVGYEDGKNEIINNPHNYNLYSKQEYLDYGSSKDLEGYSRASQEITPDLASSGFLKLFSSIMNAPYNILHNILNFDIFGVNLWSLFTFIFSMGLTISVLRLVL